MSSKPKGNGGKKGATASARGAAAVTGRFNGGSSGRGNGGSRGRGNVATRGRGAAAAVTARPTGTRSNGKGPLKPTGPDNTHASTSSGRSDPNRHVEVARGQNGIATQTSPRGQSVVAGTSARGGASSFSSDNTVSGSVSRTRLPSQYPPSSEQPRGQQLQPPIRATMSPPPVEMEVGLEDQEEDYGDFRVEVEVEDEVNVPNPEDQDFDLLLQNLFQLPGREQLVRLSEHPVPNVETTW